MYIGMSMTRYMKCTHNTQHKKMHVLLFSLLSVLLSSFAFSYNNDQQRAEEVAVVLLGRGCQKTH